MAKKKKSGSRELAPIVLEDSSNIEAASLMRGIEYIRHLRRTQQSYESEASARGQELGGSGSEAQTARTLGDKAMGALEILEEIHELPEGAVNWSEVIDRAVLKPED